VRKEIEDYQNRLTAGHTSTSLMSRASPVPWNNITDIIRKTNVPLFIIERNIPGASALSEEALRQISAKSNAVVAGLGEPYNWVTSYVAGDKIYCIHEAESAQTIYRHAKEGGFPADLVTEVKTSIGPQTAQSR
jgi:hypothetical protein